MPKVPRDHHDAATVQDDPAPARLLTVPNALSFVRIGGSLVLLWLASIEQRGAFVGLFIGLALTDWLDGKIAVYFHQRSSIGPRLDTVADVLLYVVLCISLLWLEPQFLQDHWILLTVLAASYALSVVVCELRFRRMPAYHTRAAKTCWLLCAAGALILLAGGTEWPALVALGAVIVTNIEATAISFVLKEWHTDVPSIWHARRLARQE